MTDQKQYELPELTYAYDSLEPAYAREMLELHHDKHHATYVGGLNTALAGLAEARDKANYDTINQLEKNLAFNYSGHVLHSIFWRNMSPDGGGSPQGDLAQAIDANFGGADALREQMSHAATGVQGSGWSAMSYEPISGGLIVHQIYDHQGNFGQGTVPLLVLDMWEHAYYLQYKNEKKKWAKAFWDVVNWPDVAERLQKARALKLTAPS